MTTTTIRTRHPPRSPAAPDDIDGCILMYSDEPSCECLDEEFLNVTLNERGQPICMNCGRRRA